MNYPIFLGISSKDKKIQFINVHEILSVMSVNTFVDINTHCAEKDLNMENFSPDDTVILFRNKNYLTLTLEPQKIIELINKASERAIINYVKIAEYENGKLNSVICRSNRSLKDWIDEQRDANPRINGDYE